MNQFKQKWTLDRQKFLSEVEVKKLCRVLEDKALADLQKGRTTWPRFWMAIDLAISAGLRVSEIAGLKVGNLFLNPREPRLLVTGKGQKTRDVYISKGLMKHLSEYLKWKRLLDEPKENDDPLLMSSHGKGYSMGRAKKHINEIDSVEIDPIVMKIMKDLKTAKVNFSGRQARDLKRMFVACKTLSGVSSITFDTDTLTAITMSNIGVTGRSTYTLWMPLYAPWAVKNLLNP